MPLSELDSAPEKPRPGAQHVSLARLRLRPGKNALSENPLIFGAVQYTPVNLKRAIPSPVVEFIRRLLSPRSSRRAAAAAATAEPLRGPTVDWLGPYFDSVGLEG